MSDLAMYYLATAFGVVGAAFAFALSFWALAWLLKPR